MSVTKHCRVSLHSECVRPNTQASQSLTCTACKQRQKGRCSITIAKCNDGSCEILVKASAILCDGVVRSKPPWHTCRVCKHGASCVWVCKLAANQANQRAVTRARQISHLGPKKQAFHHTTLKVIPSVRRLRSQKLADTSDSLH